ncbi:hypothetical protein Q1695_000019 [Nippostrongylus brasiliensis]|nr:hypothetical protein Q1695_000019 [Nippostrongylus brasiliensis]
MSFQVEQALGNQKRKHRSRTCALDAALPIKRRTAIYRNTKIQPTKALITFLWNLFHVWKRINESFRTRFNESEAHATAHFSDVG